MMENNQKKLTLAEKLSYGMGDCGANVVIGLGGFLTAYYTDTVGIAAAAIGTMMLASRIFDGVTDLIMGGIVDKTKSKYGKARPWMLWTAPLMMIALALEFMVPASWGDGAKLAYAYITYIFQNCIVYTANNLPFNALLSRMTLDVQDRGSAAAIRFIMTQFTTLIVTAVTTSLINRGTSWSTMALGYGFVAMIMCLICFFGCKEHIGEDSTGALKVENVPFKTAFPALLKNKYFFIQALLFLVLYIGVCVPGVLGVYFTRDVLGNLGLMTLMSMCTTIPAIIANFAMPTLIGKVGKRKLMLAGSIMMFFGSILVGLGGSSLPIVVIGMLMKGLGNGPISSGIFAMTADIVDYGEWKTGVRSEGLVNCCTSFGMKVGIGLGLAAGSWILAIGGYDGSATVQSAGTLAAIRFGYGYLGAIIAAACFVLILLMNIDKYIKEIQTSLEEKHRVNA